MKLSTIMPYFSFLVGYCFDTSTFKSYLNTRFILSFARTTMLRLAQHRHDQAIDMLQTDESVRGVARRFACNRVAIYDLQRRFQDTGRTLDRQRSGRPRVTTPNQDRRIRLIHIRDRFCSAAGTAAETPGRANNHISAKSVIRRFREHGLRTRRPYVGMVINDRRRRLRRNWANNHRRGVWKNQDWLRVIFSDESRFKLYRADGRQRVYRRISERFAPCYVNPVDSFGGGSVMVWGAIQFGWRSQFLVVDGNLTANRYLDTVLSNQIIPYVSFTMTPFLCTTTRALA